MNSIFTEPNERYKTSFFIKNIRTTQKEERTNSRTKYKLTNDISCLNNTESSNFSQYKFNVNNTSIASKNKLNNNENKINTSYNDYNNLTRKLRSLEIQRSFNEENLNNLIKKQFKNSKKNNSKLNYLNTKTENNKKKINYNPKNIMSRSFSCNFSNNLKTNIYYNHFDNSKDKQIRKEINTIVISLKYSKNMLKKSFIIKKNKSSSKLFCLGYQKSLKNNNNFDGNENSKKENKRELMKMKILSKCKLIDINDDEKKSRIKNYFDFNYNRKYIDIVQNCGVKYKNKIPKKSSSKMKNDLIDTISFINS